MAGDRSTWPFWVRLLLTEVPNRNSACAYLRVCFAIAIGGVLCSFIEPAALAGSLMVLPALPLYLSIRWVDRNGTW